MKVLMLNGSGNETGCTHTAMLEVGKALEANGVNYEVFQLGKKPQLDCIACCRCMTTGICAFNENGVNDFVEMAKDFDGFIFGTPVYYAHPSGRILSFLDRVFFSNSKPFMFKPGAVIASARRAGTTASLDALSKYISYAGMPMVGSSYWNMVHGNSPKEVMQDLEGLQTMRNLGTNMAWLIKCIEAGKAQGLEMPKFETNNQTNFIR